MVAELVIIAEYNMFVVLSSCVESMYGLSCGEVAVGGSLTELLPSPQASLFRAAKAFWVTWSDRKCEA